MSLEGRRIRVSGTVQGVGFRPFVWRLARERGLGGFVRNDPRGVEIEAFGDGASLDAFERGIVARAPAAAAVGRLESCAIPPRESPGFAIVESPEPAAAPASEISIPAELATCADCEREIADPGNRRFRHAFASCTACGPRFTIATDVPWDRARTTLAPFPMCSACRAEYDDPADRRFHAQPISCPECGPRLALLGGDGSPVQGDPLEGAAVALAARAVVAVRGLGGFHFAVDATNRDAVRRLRERKHRDAKPFAVLLADVAEARLHARLSAEEERLLASSERPIVLLRRLAGSPICADVAPGSPFLGLMLAGSPLHRLLVEAVGRPLVLTSGNVSGEPMAIGNGEALERLRGIADLFLVHDREIANRCDDSVVRVVAGAPLPIRRSRGFVPASIALARPVSRPILALSGHLKTAVCLAVGDRAFLGAHVGDLETEEAERELVASARRLIRFVGAEPEAVAHDLHPDYATTRLARAFGVRSVSVQHHAAHVASATAEHSLQGTVLGVAFDGTGLGTDGTSWGGELLRGSPERYDRLATLRPIRLAGGEAAIREPWRLALAVLDDAFRGEPPLGSLPLFAAAPEAGVAAVRKLLPNAPLAHGAGRWFDAVGALVLGRAVARFEGEVAMALEGAAEGEAEPYPFHWTRSAGCLEADLRPAVRGIVNDVLLGRRAAEIAARFHETLAEAAAGMVRSVREPLPVVLTGGCFANDRLTRGVISRLADRTVLRHRHVPPGDGGLALGQVLIADAILRGERPCVSPFPAA